MTAVETIKLLLFSAAGCPPAFPDNVLRDMIKTHGYNGTIIILANSELRRLADEPNSVAESGGLTVSYGDRTESLRSILDYAQRVGYQDPEDGAAGAGNVLTGTSKAWETKEFTP